MITILNNIHLQSFLYKCPEHFFIVKIQKNSNWLPEWKAVKKIRIDGLSMRIPKNGKKNGGVDRSRTGLSDFADRCLTDWLPRLIGLFT